MKHTCGLCPLPVGGGIILIFIGTSYENKIRSPEDVQLAERKVVALQHRSRTKSLQANSL